MKTKSNWMKKITAWMLAIVISFCTFTTPVHASMYSYELVNWPECINCLKGCKTNYLDINSPTVRVSNVILTGITLLKKESALHELFLFLGHIYSAGHDKEWKAVDCCKTQIGGYFSQMLDEYVANKTASIISYDTENWWLFTETAFIVVASTGLVVYKKKKRRQQKS